MPSEIEAEIRPIKNKIPTRMKKLKGSQKKKNHIEEPIQSLQQKTFDKGMNDNFYQFSQMKIQVFE